MRCCSRSIYFFVGRPWGLEGVALAQAVLETGGWAIRHTMANRVLDLSWRQFARSLSPLWIAQAAFARDGDRHSSGRSWR